MLAAQFFENRFAQGGQVVEALAQGRHLDRQDVEAVIQVGAKLAAFDRRFKVGGGRGDHSHVTLDHFIGAHRLEFLLLQHPQQFALQGQGHVADLIEKQRAALGDLQLAGASLAIGAGEGAGGRAEKLGFQQRFGNRRAVDADKSFMCPGRGAVNCLGQQFLAGTGFPQQQHRRVGAGAASGTAFDLQAGGAGADEVSKGVLGLAGPQQGAGGGQFLLHAQVALEHRRQAAQFIEQGKADGADHGPGIVVDRQAHHHQRFLGGVLHVQQDRPAAAHHLAQQAAGDHAFAGLADGHGGRLQAKAPGITLVHPDDIGIAVDNHRAFARLLDDLEQGADRQRAYALVVLEVFAGVHRFISEGWVMGAIRSGGRRAIMPTPDGRRPTVLWCRDVAVRRTHHGWRRVRPPCRP